LKPPGTVNNGFSFGSFSAAIRCGLIEAIV